MFRSGNFGCHTCSRAQHIFQGVRTKIIVVLIWNNLPLFTISDLQKTWHFFLVFAPTPILWGRLLRYRDNVESLWQSGTQKSNSTGTYWLGREDKLSLEKEHCGFWIRASPFIRCSLKCTPGLHYFRLNFTRFLSPVIITAITLCTGCNPGHLSRLLSPILQSSLGFK